MDIRQAVVFELRHNLNNGHCFLPFEKITAAVCRIAEEEPEPVACEIQRMIDEGFLSYAEYKGTRAVYLPYVYDAESNIASCLSGLRSVSVITGGPGTGKTTSIRKLLDSYEKSGLKVLLAAPTGRAAKRITEVTGRDASTIHRMLGAAFDEFTGEVVFTKNEDERLDCDAVIVDESSMINVLLFEALVKAMPARADLVLVGDVDQLPPIGPGNVFRSVIRSGVYPVTELTEVHRQEKDSLIPLNAQMINRGEYPDFNLNKDGFYRMQRSAGDTTLELISSLCSERLPVNMGIAPEDIQVITPTKQGELGTYSLNMKLQQVLNPAAPTKRETEFNGRIFREGDRVMQIRNNYEIFWHSQDYSQTGTGMFNGDIGYITEIGEDEIYIDFDGRTATYYLDTLSDIEHAWAVTVHKAQGCEFRAVILALSGDNPRLLSRSILYTAVTRAREIIILVGDERIARQMIDNSKRSKRYTFLTQMIRETAENS